MNIIKGIDRVTLIMAFLTFPIGFILGFGIAREEYKTISPKYARWEKQLKEKEQQILYSIEKEEERKKRERVKEIEEGMPEKWRNTTMGNQILEARIKDEITIGRIRSGFELAAAIDNAKERAKGMMKQSEPPKYEHPVLLSLGAGLGVGSLYFLVVLFGIRGLSRGIRHLSIWVLNGFRDSS